jgi:hypothetical protein
VDDSGAEIVVAMRGVVRSLIFVLMLIGRGVMMVIVMMARRVLVSMFMCVTMRRPAAEQEHARDIDDQA